MRSSRNARVPGSGVGDGVVRAEGASSGREDAVGGEEEVAEVAVEVVEEEAAEVVGAG